MSAQASVEPEHPVRPPLRPHPLGIYTDPGLITTQQSHNVHSGPVSDALLPRAVVLSGLENATMPCQRALSLVLLQRKIVLEDDEELGAMNSPEWTLPDDFMFVLVCPWDPRERPGVYKGIVSDIPSAHDPVTDYDNEQLDHFSLSATIGLARETRQHYSSYMSSLLPATTPPTTTTSPKPTLALQPSAPTPLPSQLLHRLRELSTPEHVHIDGGLRLYLTDLMSAIRHHHELDGMLIGARAMRDAEALIRAHRVLCGTDGGTGLIENMVALEVQSAEHTKTRGGGLASMMATMTTTTSEDEGVPVESSEVPGFTSTSDDAAFPGVRRRKGPGFGEEDIDDSGYVLVSLKWDNTNVVGSARGENTNGLLHATTTNAAAHGSSFSLNNSSTSSLAPGFDNSLGAGRQRRGRGAREWWDVEDEKARWDVSEVDVAKVVPRVVSHRLRVRSGPEDEVLSSVVFTAVPPIGREGEHNKGTWKRRTVKDILVKLLGEV